MEPAYNFLTFHRDDARHRYFSAPENRDPFFEAATKTWIVTDPLHCRQLISSDKLHPASYAGDYEVLSKRFGIDFSALVFAFNHIPLCLHGDRHAQSRRRASEFLAARKAVVSARIPEITARHFDRLRCEGQHELMDDVIAPMVHEYLCLIVGFDIDPALDCQSASQVFDRSIGINKRRRIETEIASLRDIIVSRLGSAATEEEIGLRLAYFILGKDPLKGMLGESLHRVLQADSGARLMEISYPESPPETGVPYIERLVETPFELADREFKQGDRVRIFLQSFAYAHDAGSRSNFFGAGPHACLGRPLSMEIWKGVAGFLSTVPLRAQVLSYAPRTTDYVFTCPEHLNLEMRQ